MSERQKLETGIQTVLDLEQEASDSVELIELAEGDEDMLGDVAASLKKAAARAEKAELEALLSGEADGNDCYMNINAGAGGTESQDWASMLRRMYVRWAEKAGYTVEEVESHEGDEAGIKSATLLIKGDNAYGWLKAEQGVHRALRGAIRPLHPARCLQLSMRRLKLILIHRMSGQTLIAHPARVVSTSIRRILRFV
jgi:peptide chain release factor 2